MQQAVSIVKSRHATGQYLPYALLRTLYKKLSKRECDQLTDIIISTYNVIDYPASIQFFDTFDKMLTAIHSTTGSEHDLNEVFTGKDDRWYARFSELIQKEFRPKNIHDILAFPTEKRKDLFLFLSRQTMAPAEQIAKYLRIDPPKRI